MIVVVAPRRVAVRSAAQRMAGMLGQSVGQTVGYAMRDETRTSSNTRILVVTDGVMLNMIQTDPELNGISVVILDEFHERGIGSDTALALTREIQRTVRPDDLRIVVITLLGDTVSPSSTGTKLVNALGGEINCHVIESEGRRFPIQVVHANDVVKMRKRSSNSGGEELAGSRQTVVALKQVPARGDVLVFLPGVTECNKVVAELQSRRDVTDQAGVFALYGSMSKTEQDKVLYPSKSARQRIVVSTPITEASVTLERVTCVVDSGLRREPRCDVDTGMSRLVTTKISKASAIQRAGRAGRVQEGICLRMYTENDFESGLLDQTPPEIFNTDLAPTLLLLAEWGTSTLEEIIQELPFVDRPSEESLEKAKAFLVDIGALRCNKDDRRFVLTDKGRRICEIPCHPRLSMAIVQAENSQEDALLCAAIAASFCLDEDLQGGGSQDLDIRASVVFERSRENLFSSSDGTSTGPDGISRIRSFVPISKDLKSSSEKDLVYTVPSKGYEVRAKRIAAIGQLEISSSPLPRPTGEQVTMALWEAMTGLGGIRKALLQFFPLKDKEAVDELVARIQLDQNLCTESDLLLPWPSWVTHFAKKNDGDSLIENELRTLVEPWLGSVKSLKELDVLSILKGSLSHDQLKYLEAHYPSSVESPDGSMIPIKYAGDGPPTATAKLQRFFGTTKTPTVGPEDNAMSITISMLSPAGRPLAKTSDLPFCWSEVYPSIRLEMRGRYPKHPWPEDPLLATATRKSKKRLDL
ncbi:ATP-dependent helicase [Nitzschia inconspicua]|uniref:ATP-dependent helicase n=1 Tax=Nitzschia inconspicua TaxID=303405 RepID=A0A9K3KTS4_9STRA|nr:ATP-dependent helicase [Nitzschia inconspicua]